MSDLNCKNILTFIHQVENLKQECRHSWTSKGRQESVAEHSWRLVLLVLVCYPHLCIKVDLLKALKLAILHDIGEAKIGDKHYLEIEKNKLSKSNRLHDEKLAIVELSQLLGQNDIAIYDLWDEFQYVRTPEAELVNCLDKLEACIQHNEANITTWTDDEISSIDEYFKNIKSNDIFIQKFKNLIKDETMKKLLRSNKKL